MSPIRKKEQAKADPPAGPQDQTEAKEDLVVEAVAPPARRVRAAWLSGPDTPSALGRILQPLAIGLMDEMVDVVALCPQQADVRELPSPPVEVIPYGRPPWWSFRDRTLDYLADQLRKRKVELIHALEVSVADLAHDLAALLDVPYLVNSFTLEAGGWQVRAEHGAWSVLAASDTIRQDLLDRRVSSEAQTRLVRPGIYQVRNPTCFIYPQHHVVIAAGGRLDDFVAFDAVLRTFAEIRKRKYDSIFFIIGNGRSERLIRDQARKLGLLHDLTFVDRPSGTQLAGIFKAADLYISPVVERDIDINSLLAMAAGVPVLACGGGASDFLVQDDTALFFRQGDSEQLTETLCRLLDDHGAASAIAASALEHLRARHSPTQMVGRYAEIYRQAAEGAIPVAAATAG